MAERTGVAARLKEARESVGLTQQQVADWLGVRRPAIAEIEAGARAVKSDELARLGALYGRSLTWLVEGELGAEERMKAALFRADVKEDPILYREAARLARRCEIIFELERKLDLRQHRGRPPQYSDASALDDWSDALAHGREVAYQERARLGIGESASLRDPWGVVEDAGIRVFPLELGREHPIDGIFTRGGNGNACVGVNTDKWVFRQNFTVVHEYAHALLDRDVSGEACATSRAWSRDRSRYANRELRANQFAAVFLVPREALVGFLESRGKLGRTRRPRATGLTAVDIVRAQDHFGASGEMILWRLQNEDLIDGAQRKRLADELKQRGTFAIARSLGYDLSRFAQPYSRAHEIALQAYADGHVSLGILSELLGKPKEDTRIYLRELGIEPGFAETDALVGGEV